MEDYPPLYYPALKGFQEGEEGKLCHRICLALLKKGFKTLLGAFWAKVHFGGGVLTL